MKYLVCHPGASWSVHDVWVGLVEAMRASDLGVAEFRLDGRITRTNDFLHFLWRRTKRDTPEHHWPKPTYADVIYQASMGLVERALARQCDAVLVVTAMFLNSEVLVLANRAGLKVYLVCTESPYDTRHEAKFAALADGVWTNERTAVGPLQAACPRVAYLPHAWRRGVHEATVPTLPAARAHDVVFVGSYFRERQQLLEAVDWTGIDLGLYGATEMIPKRSPLRRYVCGGLIPNTDAAALYRQARIGLNLYRLTPPEAAPAESLNPRAYELAAAKVCQVSEARAEVREVFGDAVPTFRTPAELGHRLRALLADETACRQLSLAAARAVEQDTWDSRVEQMRRDLNRWAAEAVQPPASIEAAAS